MRVTCDIIAFRQHHHILTVKVFLYYEVDNMGSGNNQHRPRRHRQGPDKKAGGVVFVQQSMQQAPKNNGQPKPHSEPKPPLAVNGARAQPPSTPSAAEKNTVPPAEEPPAQEKPLPMHGMKTARHTAQNTPTPRGDLTYMLDTLRQLFVHDRMVGARPDATRCGICYLMFTPDEVVYREDEGFYACVNCAGALGPQRLPMLRRQKRSAPLAAPALTR